MKHNLESKNEIYKGVFRTPFAFLLGGPIGFISNIIFTAYKSKDEIKREEEHKKYIDSIYLKQSTLREYKEKKAKEKKRTNELISNNIEYLKCEFRGSKDFSFTKGFHVSYLNTKDFLNENKFYKARFILNYGIGSENTWVGSYYPIDDFIVKYKNDLNAGNILEKNTFYNNNVRATYGYKTNNEYIFTGMFTIV